MADGANNGYRAGKYSARDDFIVKYLKIFKAATATRGIYRDAATDENTFTFNRQAGRQVLNS